MLQDGQVIRETYEVERFLGEGAFAEVYRVKHRFLGQTGHESFQTGRHESRRDSGNAR